VAWSLGGTEGGAVTRSSTGEISTLVFLAPAYGRAGASRSAEVPAKGTAFNKQTSRGI